MANRWITFANGREVLLTQGEYTVLHRYRQRNGTDTGKPLQSPGHVKLETVVSLVGKGVMIPSDGVIQVDGLVQWAQGLWPLQ